MAKPFWSEGLRFECQQSGRCCTSRGEYGYIYLTPEDRERLASSLGMSLTEFVSVHCQETDGYVHLRNPELDCEFLEGARCGVYEGRPEQCRTWPFWPENMKARVWRGEIAPFCPGIGKGRLYTAEEIRQELKRIDESRYREGNSDDEKASSR